LSVWQVSSFPVESLNVPGSQATHAALSSVVLPGTNRRLVPHEFTECGMHWLILCVVPFDDVDNVGTRCKRAYIPDEQL
jgi:hypothetical protein